MQRVWGIRRSGRPRRSLRPVPGDRLSRNRSNNKRCRTCWAGDRCRGRGRGAVGHRVCGQPGLGLGVRCRRQPAPWGPLRGWRGSGRRRGGTAAAAVQREAQGAGGGGGWGEVRGAGDGTRWWVGLGRLGLGTKAGPACGTPRTTLERSLPAMLLGAQCSVTPGSYAPCCIKRWSKSRGRYRYVVGALGAYR